MDNKTKEFSINFCSDGTIKSVYYDDFFANKEQLNIERVTDVEFDNSTQQWVARLKKTGQIIATNKKREEVLSEEVKIVHEMLFNGIDLSTNETTN